MALICMLVGVLSYQARRASVWPIVSSQPCTHCVLSGFFLLQEVPRIWSNPPYNFDNIGMALVSLFVTVTLNGYMGKSLAKRELQRCCFTSCHG